jgi:ribosomal-protein-alanine N-acetyltransferase
MYEALIETDRLELHHIPADGLIALLDQKSDALAIAGRKFSNPYRVLIDDDGPLPWRVPQVKADATLNKWFIRFIVLKESGEVVGSTSFHGAPDATGMIEIGIGIEEKFWGKGIATESLLGMWRWVVTQPSVKMLRYTVSPSNLASVKIIQKFEFHHQGQQMDEIDGPEDIYEMSVDEFSQKWGSR